MLLNDEETLVSFMVMSEKQKDEDDSTCSPASGSLWDEVALIWNFNANYEGSYREDYQVLQNSYQEEGKRTCWQDKYTTVIYNPDRMSDDDKENWELQPIPDFVCWLQTNGELHYLPIEKTEENGNS